MMEESHLRNHINGQLRGREADSTPRRARRSEGESHDKIEETIDEDNEMTDDG